MIGVALLGFALGLIGAFVGQWFAHRLTLAREERTDFIATLDRAIASLIAGEHSLHQFISKVGTGAPPPIVQASADQVSSHQIGMRAAFVSLRVRLEQHDPMILALNRAEEKFEATYMATEPALLKHETGEAAMASAFEAARQFKAASDDALDIANARFTRSDSLLLSLQRAIRGKANGRTVALL
jgi:hypothetical protein